MEFQRILFCVKQIWHCRLLRECREGMMDVQMTIVCKDYDGCANDHS